MNQVVLLGDSIFDNGAYVRGGPNVVTQLQELLPQGWTATLKAVDGSVVSDVHKQAERLPVKDAFLVVSAGGNDALGSASILEESASSSAEVLMRLSSIQEKFERGYRSMLEAILRHKLPTALCTIYYPRFTDPQVQRLAITGLTIFNDTIIRQAFSHGLPLIDLRLLCNDDADYANPIEPSVQGGQKIATAIAALVTRHDFQSHRTEVFI